MRCHADPMSGGRYVFGPGRGTSRVHRMLWGGEAVIGHDDPADCGWRGQLLHGV